MSLNQHSKINEYLNHMVQKGASDLFITVDVPISYRIGGTIQSFDNIALSNDNIYQIVRETLTEEQLGEFESTYEINLALKNAAEERFRVNIFYQQRSIGMVIRHIKSSIPPIESLGLPHESIKDVILRKRGLFLVAGATGCGKSTTIASALQYRNQQGSGHIVTIEDPIEYVFKHDKCIFTQREVGIDTYSYGIALKNALRQSPDVVFIGEIRDRESMENALTFCETGHLVVATIHANNAVNTFERILSFYSEDMLKQVSLTLMHNLVSILSQRLVKSTDDKLIVAYEILKNEGLITELIRDNRFNDIKDVMLKNLANGMMTFDESLYELYKRKKITRETALKESDNSNYLRLKLSNYSDINLNADLRAKPKTSVENDDIKNLVLRRTTESTDF